MVDEEEIAGEIEALAPFLREGGRRVWAATEARALGLQRTTGIPESYLAYRARVPMFVPRWRPFVDALRGTGSEFPCICPRLGRGANQRGSALVEDVAPRNMERPGNANRVRDEEAYLVQERFERSAGN